MTPQDEVLIFCTVAGRRENQLVQITDARKIYHADRNGKSWSAIQLTTASSLCAVLDLHVAGQLPQRGLVRQEQVRLEDFLANRFGRIYDTAKQKVVRIRQQA
jgi:saccharopine dehydrogenase-like NADP-dependent oxidoreductase